MEAHEIPGIVQELVTSLAHLKETASDKESDLQTMEEDITRARTELDNAANEWDNILEQLSDFNPERLSTAIEEAERLLGDN
jgi:DNA repair ATPase RecN|tara:strand:+ start:745 stop:990 length:246 start_codon:yes stop_codon:yes gene_type:complete